LLTLRYMLLWLKKKVIFAFPQKPAGLLRDILSRMSPRYRSPHY
jgi:hypothetical protein